MVIYYAYDYSTWQTLHHVPHFMQNKYSLLQIMIKKKIDYYDWILNDYPLSIIKSRQIKLLDIRIIKNIWKKLIYYYKVISCVWMVIWFYRYTKIYKEISVNVLIQNIENSSKFMEMLGKILRNDILRNNRDFEVVLLIYIMLCVVIVVKHIWLSGRYYTSLTQGVRSPSLA